MDGLTRIIKILQLLKIVENLALQFLINFKFEEKTRLTGIGRRVRVCVIGGDDQLVVRDFPPVDRIWPFEERLVLSFQLSLRALRSRASFGL